MQIYFMFVIGVVCLFSVRLLSGVSSEGTRTARLNYEQALRDKNKAEAVRWGRVYFGSLRWINGYRVTIYDEQRIQNDINAHC